MSHNSPPETMMSKSFFAKKKKNIFIIPAFRWATNSSTTIIQPPPLVRIPLTRNRSRGTHCRCNPRCKTTFSNQQFSIPWSNIEHVLCTFHSPWPVKLEGAVPQNVLTSSVTCCGFAPVRLPLRSATLAGPALPAVVAIVELRAAKCSRFPSRPPLRSQRDTEGFR